MGNGKAIERKDEPARQQRGREGKDRGPAIGPQPEQGCGDAASRHPADGGAAPDQIGNPAERKLHYCATNHGKAHEQADTGKREAAFLGVDRAKGEHDAPRHASENRGQRTER